MAPAAIVSSASGSDPDVRVTGFTIRMFATPAQHGAIARRDLIKIERANHAAGAWHVLDDDRRPAG